MGKDYGYEEKESMEGRRQFTNELNCANWIGKRNQASGQWRSIPLISLPLAKSHSFIHSLKYPLSLFFVKMIPHRPLLILLFCAFASTPSKSSEEENALLGALKRVILSTAPAGLLKNLTRITLYRNLPAQTQVINFPTENGQIPQQRGMPIAFSSYPSSKSQQQTGLSLANPCDQPQQVGTGPYRIPRWFFNPSHSQCELFYWSGCCGNSNNFANREMCQRSCEVAPKSSSSTKSAAIPSQYPTKFPQHNSLTYLTQKATFSTTFSPIDSEFSHPQFPITPPPHGQQINDGLPADWISLEGNVEEEVAEKELANWRRASSLIETPVAANPCAFGTNTNQMLLCQPAAPSICPGPQFCHVGDSPITTVCCNKPASVDVCHQPLNPGIGKSTLQRWYFYSPAGQCQTFTYRGLQGNENNFLSRVDCEQICPANPCAVGTPLRDIRGQLGYCSAAQQSICPAGFYCHIGGDARTSLCCPIMAGNPCSQPMNAGQGFYQLQRWFWDAAAGCCRPFVYRGQKGNQNNFCSIEECNQACNVPLNPCRLPIDLPLQQCEPGPEACDGRSDLYCHVGASTETTVCCPAEENRCQQPIEIGEGTNQLPRFGYDAQNQQCRQFAYRGLKGNQNNFLSLEECEMACLPNPCPSGTSFVGADGRIQSCAVSTSMSTCPNGYWCHVGVNTASTVCCPDANPNPCQLPMSSGDGFARLERFYFDPASKSCKSFIYKGLKGNQNNFLTLRSCQLACLPLDNPCIGQPAKTASGQILFCSATNRDTCPVNFWCHLGAIPETTVCCPGATNPCSVPLAPGTGNAGLARWYYNADDRQCVSFQYNGKRGNQNNFLTQDECQNMCPAALCLLSIDRGSCSGRQTRYAFSREKSQCIPFEYSGCGGNLNNFGTMQECQQICGNVRI